MKNNPKLMLVKCPRCGHKNYAPAIEENICVYCEYEAGLDDVDGKNVLVRFVPSSEEQAREELELQELRNFGNQFNLDEDEENEEYLPF